MNRPSLFTYLIGNTLGTVIVFGAGAYGIYGTYVGRISAFFGVLGIWGILRAYQANRELADYRNWKRAWDAMEGGQSGTSAFGFLGILFRFVTIALVLFVGLGAFLDLEDSPPRRMLFDLGYLGVLAAMSALWLTLRIRRRRRKVRREPPAKEFIASISLPVPRRSPGRNEIYQPLPDYCSGLLTGA